MLSFSLAAVFNRFALLGLAAIALAYPFDSPGELDDRFLAGKLMVGTPYETPLYVMGRDKGPVVLVLGGVHGDEPGGRQAALDLVAHPPKFDGRIIVIPQANKVADEAGVRSTPEIGDLNRLYPGRSSGLPMSVMAAQIVDVVRRYGVQVVVDLHESWDYLANMPPQPPGMVDTGYVGQTISADPGQLGVSLAKATVARANADLEDSDAFTYFEFPEGYEDKTLVEVAEDAAPGETTNKSSTYLAQMFPGLAAILVEVSQQPELDRRVELELAAVQALLREVQQRYRVGRITAPPLD